MMLHNIKWIALAALFICCTASNINELFVLPENLTEVSAIETTPNSEFLWTLQDSGNKPELYALDKHGKLAGVVKISGVENRDWEELASDRDGNLYIGDFGNNDNERRDLAIYQIRASDLKKETATVSIKTGFNYPEQSNFPPEKSQKWFDAEAFFVYGKSFYIFTKDRSDVGMTRLYKVPAENGNHTAQFLGSFATGAGKKNRVTAADITDDGKKVILISNKKAWVFSKFADEKFLAGAVCEIELTGTQLEGVCFKNSSTVYLVDELDKGIGGKIYKMEIE